MRRWPPDSKLQPNLTGELAGCFFLFFTKGGIHFLVAGATAGRCMRFLDELTKCVSPTGNCLCHVGARYALTQANLARPHQTRQVHVLRGYNKGCGAASIFWSSMAVTSEPASSCGYVIFSDLSIRCPPTRSALKALENGLCPPADIQRTF